MTNKKRKLRSFRIDEQLLKRLDELGIDKTSLIESAIATVIDEKKCPYCGGRLEENNEPK